MPNCTRRISWVSGKGSQVFHREIMHRWTVVYRGFAASRTGVSGCLTKGRAGSSKAPETEVKLGISPEESSQQSRHLWIRTLL